MTKQVALERRHFEFIAQTLKQARPTSPSEQPDDMSTQWAIIVGIFTEACAKTNPQFNKDRFIKACA
jgi:hypothetical protein